MDAKLNSKTSNNGTNGITELDHGKTSRRTSKTRKQNEVLATLAETIEIVAPAAEIKAVETTKAQTAIDLIANAIEVYEQEGADEATKAECIKTYAEYGITSHEAAVAAMLKFTEDGTQPTKIEATPAPVVESYEDFKPVVVLSGEPCPVCGKMLNNLKAVQAHIKYKHATPKVVEAAPVEEATPTTTEEVPAVAEPVVVRFSLDKLRSVTRRLDAIDHKEASVSLCIMNQNNAAIAWVQNEFVPMNSAVVELDLEVKNSAVKVEHLKAMAQWDKQVEEDVVFSENLLAEAKAMLALATEELDKMRQNENYVLFRSRGLKLAEKKAAVQVATPRTPSPVSVKKENGDGMVKKFERDGWQIDVKGEKRGCFGLLIGFAKKQIEKGNDAYGPTLDRLGDMLDTLGVEFDRTTRTTIVKDAITKAENSLARLSIGSK